MKPLLPSTVYTEQFLAESIKAGKLSNFGPCFEAVVKLGRHNHNRYFLPVSNGTHAITVAAQTILPPHSRVVIPDYTHIGTYAGIKAARMHVMIAPVSPSTWSLSLPALTRNVDKFDAFVVVAPFGYYVDTAPYERFAKAHGKKIIYDYAGAWGQFPNTKFPICYSTHATKHFTTGEGGIVSYRNEADFLRGKKIINFDIDEYGLPSSQICNNYKMDEIRCAMLAAHLCSSRIEERMQRRRKVLLRYLTHFKVDYTLPMFHKSKPSMAVIPMFPNKFSRLPQGFMSKFYYPNLAKVFPTESEFGVSSMAMNKNLALPIDVTQEQQDVIIKEVKACLMK